MHTRTRLTLATLVAAVITLAGFAGTASAHHPSIVGVATCADADGDYQVTWTVTADAVRGLTWAVDDRRAKPDDQPFEYLTEHNLDGPAPSLTVTATWSNGVTGTRTGTVDKPEQCPPPETTTTTTVVETTTTTTVVDVCCAPVPTTTTTTLVPSLPATGTGSTIAVIAGIVLIVGACLVLARAIRR